jgi:hypothetical protein
VTDFSDSCLAPRWSKDGTLLYFRSHQRDNSDIYTIGLVPKKPEFDEDKLDKLFPSEETEEEKKENDKKEDEEKKKEKKEDNKDKKEDVKVKIILEGITRRIECVTEDLDSNEYYAYLTPDGKTWVFMSDLLQGPNIWTLPKDNKKEEPPKRITKTKADKSYLRLTSDGKKAYFLTGGRIMCVTLAKRSVKPVPVKARMKIDRRIERAAAFRELRWMFDRFYYDDTFHGVALKASSLIWSAR